MVPAESSFQIRPFSEVPGLCIFWGAPFKPASSLSSQHTPFPSLSPCRVSFLQRLTAGDQEMPPPRWVSGGPFCSVMLKGGTENRIKEERLLIVVRLADVYILRGAEGYSGRSGLCPRGPWMTPVPGSVSGTWALGPSPAPCWAGLPPSGWVSGRHLAIFSNPRSRG